MPITDPSEYAPRCLERIISTRTISTKGGYFCAGTQGRVVGRNIFLGGNSFRTSPSVSKKNLGDAQAGFSVLWSKSLRLDISVALRTKEFQGQRTPDDICTAPLSFTW